MFPINRYAKRTILLVFGVVSLSLSAGLLANQPHPLRVAKLVNHEQINIHRDTAVESQMLVDAAASIGRTLQWVELATPYDLRQSLLEKSADIYVSPLPLVTDDKLSDADIASLAPIGFERYRVVTQNIGEINSPLDLAGKKIAVKFSSPVLSYLRQLRATLKNLKLVVLPDTMPRQDLLRKVSEGAFDAVVIATNFRNDPLTGFDNLTFRFDLTTLHPVSWKAHAENSDLIGQINKFLQRYHVSYIEESVQKTILNDKVVRAIAQLNRNYSLKDGEPIGFEYDLIRRFAKANDLRLDILVARDEKEVNRWLKEGIGDIVLSQTAAAHPSVKEEFLLSREYRHDIPVVLSRQSEKITSKSGLTNKKIAIPTTTSYATSLRSLNSSVAIVDLPPQTPTTNAVAKLRAGIFDGLVVQAMDVPKLLREHMDLSAGLSLPIQNRFQWAVRKDKLALSAAVEDFLKDQYRTRDYNLLAKRYQQKQQSIVNKNQISPYDQIIKTYAEKYDFDWRLIAAQIYQESRFDPAAVSSAGARGLMQIMPATASDLGLTNPEAPEASIHAGIKYLDFLRSRFDADVPENERLWLALAAYNTGYERVKRARNLAERMGLNPNRWFDNVEIAMRKMTKPDSPASGCRCGQAIVYVRSIRSLYSAYRYVGAV